LESDLQRASPITHVTPDDPPFLILHGTNDNVVPLEQSQMLYDLLVANGVPAEFVLVENGGHGFNSSANPPREEISYIIADFFLKTLK
jgi:dipeptidyl aminopeptidase/acylaminoacyl peptidase